MKQKGIYNKYRSSDFTEEIWMNEWKGSAIGMYSSQPEIPYYDVDYSSLAATAQHVTPAHRTGQSSGMTWIIKTTQLENFIPFSETIGVKNQLAMPME